MRRERKPFENIIKEAEEYFEKHPKGFPSRDGEIMDGLVYALHYAKARGLERFVDVERLRGLLGIDRRSARCVMEDLTEVYAERVGGLGDVDLLLEFLEVRALVRSVDFGFLFFGENPKGMERLSFYSWLLQVMRDKGFFCADEGYKFPASYESFSLYRTVAVLQGYVEKGIFLKVGKRYFLPPDDLVVSWDRMAFAGGKKRVVELFGHGVSFSWTTHLCASALVRYYRRKFEEAGDRDLLYELGREIALYSLPSVYRNCLVESFQSRRVGLRSLEAEKLRAEQILF